MSWVAYLANLIPFNKLRDKVFVPPLPEDSKEIVSVSHYFPALAGLPIPFLKLDADKEIERTTKTAKIIRGLVESELFVKLLSSSCVSWVDECKKPQQEKIWENALDNPLALCLKEEGVLKAHLNFGKRNYKDSVLPLDCKVTLKHSETKKGKLQLLSIEHQGKVYTPDHPKWKKIVDLSVCAASTYTTFREHFLFSHILTTQTLHVLATHVFDQDHPIYQLIYIHSNAICWVNVCKGIPLLQASFTKDFSFADGDLKNYFGHLAGEYDIYALNPLKRLEHAQLSCKSSVYDQGITCWKIFEEYVSNWVAITYQEHEVTEDVQLVQFWDLCKTYPHLSNLGELTKANLITVLTTLIWVSIFHHETVGDEASDLMKATNVMIPKDDLDGQAKREQQVGTTMFGSFIFPVASRVPTVKLLSAGWVAHLTREYRTIATQMQAKVLAHGFTDLELSCNK